MSLTGERSVSSWCRFAPRAAPAHNRPVMFVHASRSLIRNPSSSALAIGSMAIGIGLATAMLAVLNGTLWHPLPFPGADRIVAVQGPVSSATIDDWSAAARSFGAIAGYRTKRYTLTGQGDAVSLKATVATGRLFDVLGVTAARGRLLGPSDVRSDSLVVVLSDECWRTTFHGDPALLGRTIYLSGTPFEVVGIMPPGLRFPVNTDRVDLYTTTAADLQTDRRPAAGGYPRDLMVVARLAGGADLLRAGAEMTRLRAADEAATRRPAERRATLVVPLAEDLAARMASPVTTLGWVVAGVVLIACVTASILALIRVASREREWATRLAIGATPGDLARQLLAESGLVAVVGGAAGGVIAYLVSKPLLLVAGPAIGNAARATFDGQVFLWAVLLTLASGASFGLIPTLQVASSRWRLTQARDEGGRWRTYRVASGAVARNLLVTAEVAVSVVLLVACLSLLRAYASLSRLDIGFDATSVATFRVDLSDGHYTPRQQAEFFEQLRAGAERDPRVAGAAFTVMPPFGDLRLTIRLDPPGGSSGNPRDSGAEAHLVSAGYFRAMGIPLLHGREFGPGDDANGEKVVVVSRSLANRQFPGQNALGRLLDVRLGRTDGPLPTVVGVAGDTRSGSLTAPGEPEVYVPFAQAPLRASTTFVLRLRNGDADAGAAIAAVRGHLRRLDATIPLVEVKPLADFVRGATSMPLFSALLVSVFTSAAVFLAMSGLYAVVAYASLRRRREFSIRRALGATEGRVRLLVIRHCLRVLVPGLAIGLAGALAVGRGLESALYGVKPTPAPIIVAALSLAAALSLLATWWPARAAARDDLRTRLQADA
jgi:putative ABC transport system permease protein